MIVAFIHFDAWPSASHVCLNSASDFDLHTECDKRSVLQKCCGRYGCDKTNAHWEGERIGALGTLPSRQVSRDSHSFQGIFTGLDGLAHSLQSE